MQVGGIGLKVLKYAASVQDNISAPPPLSWHEIRKEMATRPEKDSVALYDKDVAMSRRNLVKNPLTNWAKGDTRRFLTGEM